jgi:hypothetical protein
MAAKSSIDPAHLLHDQHAAASPDERRVMRALPARTTTGKDDDDGKDARSEPAHRAQRTSPAQREAAR